MLNETKITLLNKAFKRIFALPISRSSLREVQNNLMKITNGSQEESNEVLLALLNGALNPEQEKMSYALSLKKLVNEYSIQVGIAKDIFERAEFVNLLITDMLPHPTQILFANHIKRVDGEEIHFITDLESAIQVVHHFLTRVVEAEKHENAPQIFKKHTKELQSLKEKIDALTKVAE